MLAAGLEVQVEVDGDARIAGPARIGWVATVTPEIPRRADGRW